MAETAKILDLSAPIERASVILPDGIAREIKSPEDFTSGEFRRLMMSFRELEENAEKDEAFDRIDDLIDQIFVEDVDVSALSIGHKRRIVNFFSHLAANDGPTHTSSPSPAHNGSTADASTTG